MYGHENIDSKVKGLTHVQTCICSKYDQIRTVRIIPFNPQQPGCACTASCPDGSAFFKRQKGYRDSRNVGCYRSNCTANHPEFQFRWTQVVGRQTSKRPTTKNNQSLCKFTKRGGAEITTRFWLPLQFLDAEPIARTSRTPDRHSFESLLSVSTYGPGRYSLSPPEACNGTFTKCRGLQREKGCFGVFKKRAVERQARFELLYLDECEVHLHPTLTKVWTLKGTRPVVPAAGANQRLCIYGSFNYRTGQVHYMIHPKKNAKRFAQFLSQLLSSDTQRFLILVLDNASYHRTREVLDILSEHDNHVFVVWLPKYSPELNLIEGLWGYLKKSSLNNYFYGDISSLASAVDNALKELQQHPETALSLAYKTYKNLRKTA
jgi:transposase